MKSTTTPAASRGGTARRTVLMAAAASAALAWTGFAAAPALAQDQVEIVYATFLDPNNKNDPRAEAQTRMIEAFEKANPGIRVTVQPSPGQEPALRALRARSSSPDVMRFTNFTMLEAASTGSLTKLDELIERDGVSTSDWLLPLEQTKVLDSVYGLQQDYRIPILMYRKSLVEAAGVTLPTTWDEVCEAGGKLSSDSTIGYAVPVGSGGGTGGAQTLAEFMLSSMLSEDSGNYFDAEGREFTFTKEDFVRAAQTIKDLFTTCGASAEASLQFGYNEMHDGLRAGSIAMSTFGLYRYRAVESGGAGEDLGWAPPPAYKPDGKQTLYGFQIVANDNSANKDAAWEFVKFMASPEAQAIAAEAGEVVARASVYTDENLSKGVNENQRAWADLVRERGRFVGYSLFSVGFHQAVGDALQRMILEDGTPEAAYDELVSVYQELLDQ
jgi:multiple sugar transport system substrate-binding protein